MTGSGDVPKLNDEPCICDTDSDDWADHKQWCPYSIKACRDLAGQFD